MHQEKRGIQQADSPYFYCHTVALYKRTNHVIVGLNLVTKQILIVGFNQQKLTVVTSVNHYISS